MAASVASDLQSGIIDQQTHDAEMSRLTPPGTVVAPAPQASAGTPADGTPADGVAPIVYSELSPVEKAAAAAHIDEREACGKMSPEEAAQARREAGVVKGEVKSAELIEHDRVYGEPAKDIGQYELPPCN